MSISLSSEARLSFGGSSAVEDNLEQLSILGALFIRGIDEKSLISSIISGGSTDNLSKDETGICISSVVISSVQKSSSVSSGSK